jgi:hypothetical protein
MTTRGHPSARHIAAPYALYFSGGLTKMKKEQSKIRAPWNAILKVILSLSQWTPIPVPTN